MANDITCDDCGGACCRYFTLPVGKLTRDQREIAETRGKVCGGKWHVNAACKFLGDDGRCVRYATRPAACRAYKVGGKDCLEIRSQWGWAQRKGGK